MNYVVMSFIGLMGYGTSLVLGFISFGCLCRLFTEDDKVAQKEYAGSFLFAAVLSVLFTYGTYFLIGRI